MKGLRLMPTNKRPNSRDPLFKKTNCTFVWRLTEHMSSSLGIKKMWSNVCIAYN